MNEQNANIHSFVNFNNIFECNIKAYISSGPYIESVDLKQIFNLPVNEVISADLRSSIDGMYRYGSITIRDDVGFREYTSLTGNEIVTIVYSNKMISSDRPEKIIHFNIYDMHESTPSDDTNRKYTNKFITLHLMEAPFFLSYNRKPWSKAYGKDNGDGTSTNVSIDEIIKSHLLDDLKITEDMAELDFSKMSTEMHWSIPYWKPQQTLQYLLQFAKDIDGHGNVKLFTKTDIDKQKTILKLSSISNLFKTEQSTVYPVIDVHAITSGLLPAGMTSRKSANQIFDYKFESYDVVSLVSGLSGGYMYNHDYRDGKYFVHTDDYRASIASEKYFGQFGLWSDKISDWQSTSHSLGDISPELAKTYLNNKVIQQKYQLKCHIRTPVNHDRNVGDKVYLTFPSGAYLVNESATVDEQMSGEWIIKEITDQISGGRGTSEVVLIKDSFYNDVGVTSGNKVKKLPDVKPIKNMDIVP